MVSQVMVTLALLFTFVVPSIAQGSHPVGRVAATFYQAPAQRGTAAAALPGSVLGSFKADPEAPIRIEADKLVEVSDGAKQMVFGGNVTLQQGDFLLRSTALTAFYLGQSGLSNGGEWRAEQLTRAEARDPVLVKSKDGQTATGDWAIFDAKPNTVLMGDHVVVSRSKDVAQGPRLKIDLTTGIYRFELVPPSPQPPAAQIRPQ